MKRKTPKGMSWIERDQTYRVQIHGSYVGQRKGFIDAAQLLSEARKNLVGTIDRRAKKLPVGITHVKARGSFRVRVGQVHVIQTKSISKAVNSLKETETCLQRQKQNVLKS